MTDWLLDSGIDERLRGWRRVLHERPELSLKERETTAYLKRELAALEVEVLELGTETGVLARIRGGSGGRRVLLRADIDALPIKEQTDLWFSSRTPGVMHACGHDGHAAVLLGAAAELQRRRESLTGEVLLLFQPGEELAGGARAVLETGLFDRHEVDLVLGLHLVSIAPLGMVGVREGVSWAAATCFDIRFTGEGGHAAFNAGHDALTAGAAVAARLAEVVEGMTFEGAPTACSAGMLSSGTARNVTPTTARISGSLRTYTDEQRREALARLERLVADCAREHTVEGRLQIGLEVPALVNDAIVVRELREALEPSLGDSLVNHPPLPTSDDIAELFALVPGAYLVVGAAIADGAVRAHHTAEFDFDEAALAVALDCLLVGTAALIHPDSPVPVP